MADFVVLRRPFTNPDNLTTDLSFSIFEIYDTIPLMEPLMACVHNLQFGFMDWGLI